MSGRWGNRVSVFNTQNLIFKCFPDEKMCKEWKDRCVKMERNVGDGNRKYRDAYWNHPRYCKNKLNSNFFKSLHRYSFVGFLFIGQILHWHVNGNEKINVIIILVWIYFTLIHLLCEINRMRNAIKWNKKVFPKIKLKFELVFYYFRCSR